MFFPKTRLLLSYDTVRCSCCLDTDITAVRTFPRVHKTAVFLSIIRALVKSPFFGSAITVLFFLSLRVGLLFLSANLDAKLLQVINSNLFTSF